MGGARLYAAASLLAVLVPLTSANAAANAANGACALTLETAAGEIQIEPLPERDGETFLELNLTLEPLVDSANGRSSGVTLAGLIKAPVTPDAIPAALDTIWATLNFGDASRVDGPTLVYYTRDNTIPLDVAPAKLWYPHYRSHTGQFEIAVSLGDLERQMAWGPGEAPATVLSWIAKRVGTGYQDDVVIDSGDIPLAPIRDARAAMGAALEQVVAAQQSGRC